MRVPVPRTARDHPGIGFILVRSERDGATVIGGRGPSCLDTGHVEGEDPLARFGLSRVAPWHGQ